MVLHRYRMQYPHADGSLCDDSSISGGFPAQNSNTGGQIRCAKPFPYDAVHTISAAIDSQQSVHPIRTFTGGLSRRFRLRSISHADRMQKSHAARSRSRHRTFVTEVNMCAQLVILTVYFASFSSQRHSNCSTGSKGSVCA